MAPEQTKAAILHVDRISEQPIHQPTASLSNIYIYIYIYVFYIIAMKSDIYVLLNISKYKFEVLYF